MMDESEQTQPIALVPPTPVSVPSVPTALPLALKVAAGIEFVSGIAYITAMAIDMAHYQSRFFLTDLISPLGFFGVVLFFHVPIGIGLLQRSRIARVAAFVIHGLLTLQTMAATPTTFYLYLFLTLLLYYCLLRRDVQAAFRKETP